jgi:hypothetical protein
MSPQPNWKEKFVEETTKKFEDDGRIIAQLLSVDSPTNVRVALHN